jgi:uncharacterized YigZ family protein
MSQPYYIPAEQHRTEISVLKSRFLTTVACAMTVEDARNFIMSIKSEMPGANHHVYAFRVGYGNSVIEGMSDDGEPSGTSGPPSLAVLRGSNLGDIVLVTSRFFGGTKLGTGGLVRAYTQSAQEALSSLKTEIKSSKQTIGVDLPYHLYEVVKRLISAYNGKILDEIFAGEISLLIELLESDVENFRDNLREQTSGQLTVVML